jgi:hypothetical protein
MRKLKTIFCRVSGFRFKLFFLYYILTWYQNIQCDSGYIMITKYFVLKI